MSTIVDDMKKDASNATHAVENAAQATKTGFLEVIGKLAHAYGIVRSAGMNDYLSVVGFERKSNTRAFVRFSTGFVVGASAGLLFAPMSGRDLRKKVARSFGVLFSPVLDKVEEVGAKAGAVANDVIDAVKAGAHTVAEGAKDMAHDAAKVAKGGADQLVTPAKNGAEDGKIPKTGTPSWNAGKTHS